MLRDWRSADLTPRERSLCEFAAQLTREPSATRRASVDRLKAAGLDDRGILDLVHVIGFFAYANRLADGLGVDLETSMKERVRRRSDA